jgi:hypothetical protein
MSGNPSGRPQGDGRVKGIILEALNVSRPKAVLAMQRRLESPRYVQDVLELLARLEGELTRDATQGGRGVSLIIFNNQGKRPLDPDIFREAARRKALEGRAPGPDTSSG